MTRFFKLGWADLFLAIACGVGFVFWQQSAELKPPFDVYPKLVSLSLAVLCLASILQNRFKPIKQSRGASLKSLLGTIGMFAGIAIYIICISKIGYFVSTFVYLVTLLQLSKMNDEDAFLETKPLILDSMVAGGMTLGIALVFKVALNLVFPFAWLF